MITISLAQIYEDLKFIELNTHRVYVTNFIYRKRDKIQSNRKYKELLYQLDKLKKPVEYIFNETSFFGLEFYIDSRTLIPRSETEIIVTKALNILSQCTLRKIKIDSIIDVGSGSGNIIIAIAVNIKRENFTLFNQLNMFAIEEDLHACEVLKINLKKFSLTNKIKIVNNDFRKVNFNKFNKQVIVANLPYIGYSESIDNSVLIHEPYKALFGGQDGNELNNYLTTIYQNNIDAKSLIYETSKGRIIEHSKFNL